MSLYRSKSVKHKSWKSNQPQEGVFPIPMSDRSLHVRTAGIGKSGEHPTIVCFHGSGDSCFTLWWLSLAESLSKSDRVLIYDRAGHGESEGSIKQRPSEAALDLSCLLAGLGLKPPYVLLAHSYGGCIAREFLQQRPQDVAGMVLAETGQERSLAPRTEREQYKYHILGRKPLCVIRANTLMTKWLELGPLIQAARSEEEKAEVQSKKEQLQRWEVEDEKLKKMQLKLSKNSRYVYNKDCGHHVIRDGPDVVLDEVRWVLANLESANGRNAGEKGHRRGLSERLLKHFRASSSAASVKSARF